MKIDLFTKLTRYFQNTILKGGAEEPERLLV